MSSPKPVLRGDTRRVGVDLTGHTPYGFSKLLADVYIRNYYHTYGLETVFFG
jgi:hypothetical protein